jgi:hypothetical protein
MQLKLLHRSAEVIMQELQAKPTESRKPLIEFDQWAELARSDPAAFEQKRAQVIEDMIQRMPPHKQQRMRCLQWKIDRVREKAGNPVAACIKLSEMMWDSLVGPGGLRDALARLGNQDFEPPAKAKILELRRNS